MEPIVSKQPGADGSVPERVRIGRSVIILSCVGIVLEIVSSAVCHLLNRPTSLDEVLSLMATVCLVWAAFVFVHRTVRNRAVTGCLTGAVLLLLFANVLDVTGSIVALDGSFVLGHPSSFHRMLHDVSFTAGFILLLASFVLSSMQAYQAQWRLTAQNAALLRETKERVLLATAIEQSAESIVITDPEGIIQYVNPAFESLAGYARSEMAGKTSGILKSGRQDARFYKELWDTISRGDTWHGHFVNRRKDGSLYEVSSVISCVRGGDGKIVSYIAAQHDVTVQVNLERQLRQAQKMEVLGSFAGHIAHDFNNILTLVLGHSEMALRRLPENDPVGAHVRHIAKAGHRASKLIKQMLMFSRQLEQERRPVAIHVVVREVLDFLRASLPPTIRLEESVADCGMILADPTQIHQVVMNLCTNAYQALQDRSGVMTVLLEVVDLGPDFALDVGELAQGCYVRLSVRDTGNGIDAATLPHIFDPFFTTKKPGEGTGLGLSTVHGIVAGYGGGIAVHSTVGQGAVFDVYFPRLDGAAQLSESMPEGLVGGSERILFVDDNEEIAEMAHWSLEQLGYSVTAFSSSAKALAQFRDHPQDYDIVITDQVMPELTGADLARSLLGIRSDLPIILVTGFGHGITSEQAREIGISAYLMKPFSEQVLTQAIRRALKDRAFFATAEPMVPPS